MKKLRLRLSFALFLAIYLNIGYGIGWFIHHKVEAPLCQDQKERKLSLGARFFELIIVDSDKQTFAKNNCADGKYLPNAAYALAIGSIAWPAVIALTLIAWLIISVILFFKIIFLGGLFKLFFGVS